MHASRYQPAHDEPELSEQDERFFWLCVIAFEAVGLVVVITLFHMVLS